MIVLESTDKWSAFQNFVSCLLNNWLPFGEIVFGCHYINNVIFPILKWWMLVTNHPGQSCKSIKHSHAIGHIKSGNLICRSISNTVRNVSLGRRMGIQYVYNSYAVCVYFYPIFHIAEWNMYHNNFVLTEQSPLLVCINVTSVYLCHIQFLPQDWNVYGML